MLFELLKKNKIDPNEEELAEERSKITVDFNKKDEEEQKKPIIENTYNMAEKLFGEGGSHPAANSETGILSSDIQDSSNNMSQSGVNIAQTTSLKWASSNEHYGKKSEGFIATLKRKRKGRNKIGGGARGTGRGV